MAQPKQNRRIPAAQRADARLSSHGGWNPRGVRKRRSRHRRPFRCDVSPHGNRRLAERVPGDRTEPFFPLRSRRSSGLTRPRNAAAIPPSGFARYAVSGITRGPSLPFDTRMHALYSGNSPVVFFGARRNAQKPPTATFNRIPLE